MTRLPRAFLFPPFRLDLRTGALYRDGEHLSLRPKTFDTLVHLLVNQGRLVPKAELLDKIWSESFVTDDVLVQSIADIRRALGDDARNPSYVQTVPKRGYIFIRKAVALDDGNTPPGSRVIGEESGEVRLHPQALSTPGSDSRAAERGASPTSRLLSALAVVLVIALTALYWNWFRPPAPLRSLQSSIAVLPFEVQSDSDDLDWLATGVADMIGTGLWKSPDPIVSGSRLLETAHRKFGKLDALSQPEALDLARNLGANRAIVGRVIKLGTEIQINASLVDLSSGAEDLNVWERANSPEQIFDAVDAICLKLLQTLAFERGLHGAPGPHLTEITTESLEAYRHYIAGLEYFRQGGREGLDLAEIELREATRVDPGFGLAHFKLAQVRNWSRAWGYSKADPTDSLRQASLHATDLPPMERLLMGGMVARMIDGDPDRALEEWRTLEGLYPMFSAEAGVPVMVVAILVESGRLREAVEYGDPYLRSPYLTSDDKARLSSYLSKVFRQLGDIPKALSYSRRCVENWPVQDGQIYRFHLINLGRDCLASGRVEQAIRNFAKARDAGWRDASNLTDAGWGFYMAGIKGEARRLATAALQIDPDYGNAHHLLGWIELSDGETARAAASLQAAFDKTPPQFGSRFEGILDGDLPALYFAGVAYAKLGEMERAESAFSRLIDICRRLRQRDTNRTPTLGTRSLSLEALALARLGKVDQSRVLRERLLAEAEPLYATQLQLARIFAVEGDSISALKWLRQAILGGAREFQHLSDNPDFESLAPSPEFRRLAQHETTPADQ